MTNQSIPSYLDAPITSNANANDYVGKVDGMLVRSGFASVSRAHASTHESHSRKATTVDIKLVSEEIERVSQAYAEEFQIERDATWFVLKLQEEVGELIQAYLMLSGKARTKGKSAEAIQSEFHKEVADVFCHTLLLARFYGIDLEQEVREKWLRWNHA